MAKKKAHEYLGGMAGKAGKALSGRAAQLAAMEEEAMGGGRRKKGRTGESKNDNSGGRKGRK